ncbi:MAG: two-component regulator propeller domain-containing protein, partial [Croceivirga sp.]
MKIKFNLIIFYLLIYPFFSGFPQNPSSKFSLQHIKSGLSQSSATQIFEDSFGFLWIGTPNGLNKYDGTNFQIFERSHDGKIGLTDGYVEKIYEDKEKELYIGTNQGLNHYNRSLNQITPYPFKPEAQFLQSKYFGAVARTNNYLWLGTDNSGVYRYEINTGETKQIIFDEIKKGGPSNHYIVEVFPVENEKLLIITQASIYLINHNLQVLHQIENPQNLSSAIEYDENGFLIGSHEGELIELTIQNNNSFEIKKISISPGHSILSLAIDVHKNIWLGTENDGLFIYTSSNGIISHYKQDITKPYHISSNSIWSLLTAKNGVVWMGPFKNGLSFFDPEYRKFTHIKKDPFDPNSLSNNIVNCFKEDENGNLWIGTDGGGLNYWDRSKNSFQEYSLTNRKLHTDVVLCLFKDDKERLWIGSWAKGLSIFDPKTKELEVWTKENSFLGSNNVIDIHQDRKGRFWIVTLFGGVHVYYPESGGHEHIRLRSEKDGSEAATVARLLEDNNGTIWIGTQTMGLFKLVEKNDQWTPVHYHSFNDKSRLSNDFINTMVQDNNGN